MFCTKCGEQIPDDGKFCPKCGTSVVEDEIPVTPPSGKEKKPSDVKHPPKKKKEKMAMDCVNYSDPIYHCCCGDCSGEKTVR